MKTEAYLKTAEGPTVPVTTPVTPALPSTGNLSSASLSLGSTGPAVTTLQDILVNDGYLQAGIFTLGTFDPATLRAVETFQCTQGITCSGPGYGIVGPKTEKALGM